MPLSPLSRFLLLFFPRIPPRPLRGVYLATCSSSRFHRRAPFVTPSSSRPPHAFLATSSQLLLPRRTFLARRFAFDCDYSGECAMHFDMVLDFEARRWMDGGRLCGCTRCTLSVLRIRSSAFATEVNMICPSHFTPASCFFLQTLDLPPDEQSADRLQGLRRCTRSNSKPCY